MRLEYAPLRVTKGVSGAYIFHDIDRLCLRKLGISIYVRL